MYKKILIKTIVLANLLVTTNLFASNVETSTTNYKAQIMPLESFSITSETTGKIKNINFNELEYVKNNGVIIIDNEYETSKLNNLKEKLENLKKIKDLKEKNFKEYERLSSIAQTNKDDKLIDLLNLKSNILELENNINDIKDIIKKKNINIDNNYFIKDILINNNEVIKNGQEIVKIENHSKNKIIFFINSNDIDNIKNNNFIININDKILDNKNIEIKIDNSTDETYITSYKLIITFDKNIYKDINFGSLAVLSIIKK